MDQKGFRKHLKRVSTDLFSDFFLAAQLRTIEDPQTNLGGAK